jgi:hypothetical protein
VQKWWNVSWKRIGIALLILYAAGWAVFGIVILVSNQLEPWIVTRDIGRHDPRLNLVPATLPDKSLAALSGDRVEFYGFSFQIPGKKVAHRIDKKGISYLIFGDGTRIVIINPSSLFQALNAIRKDAHMDRILGQETVRTNYALMAAAMAATSDQVKWWRIPSQNARISALLGIKMDAIHDLNALYEVNSGELHGFQAGNPSIAPYKVILNLFDGADRHYQIWISGKDGSSPGLSQAEINAMVDSFRPIPHN